MSDNFDRFGPWALVTGASSGIGHAFARAIAARGISVAILARRRELLADLADQIHAAGGTALVIAVDLLADHAMETLRQALDDREIGLLVNNAGFGANGPFHRLDAARQRQMVRLNCEIPVALTAEFLPAMVERGRGGVITVASTSAYQPTPWMATYGATKAFDLHFSEALSVELEGSGVAALAVSPGHTASEFHAVAGTQGPATGGSAATAEDVVAQALGALGRKTSFVHGLRNAVFTQGRRFLPRRSIAKIAGRILGSRMDRVAAEDAGAGD